jgi:hypothetical protein
MSPITLETLKAEQTKLAQMIAAFEAQAREAIHIPEQTIDLAPGERYAGILVGQDAAPSYHVILLPSEAEDITWTDAQAWADEQGGELPSRRALALLYANLKDQFKPEWYWSGEQHTDTRYAWFQHFSYGYQDGTNPLLKLRARAVRRLEIQ